MRRSVSANSRYSAMSPIQFLFVTVASVFCVFLFLYLLEPPFMLAHFVIISVLLAPMLYFLIYRPNRLYFLQLARSEELLRTSNEQLEVKVKERAGELDHLNKLLQDEYVDALRLSEEKYRGVLDSLGAGVCVISPQMEILTVNGQLSKWHPNTDFSGKPICYKVYKGKDKPCNGCPVLKTFADGEQHQFIDEGILCGEKRFVRITSSPVKDQNGKIVAATEAVQDITDLKQVQDTLQSRVKERDSRLNLVEGKYFSFTQHSSEGIFIFDPVSLQIQEANTKLLDMLGYNEQEINKLMLSDILVADPKLVSANLQKMINQRVDIHGLRQYKRKDNSLINADVTYSILKFGMSDICLVNLRDISEQLEAELAKEQSYKNLQLTLNETVSALAAVTEKRDPYTAGHQRRVARLAWSIAKEMNLPEQRVSGILTAGTLHDIGKIYVPADILNKPGKLTDLEMDIIKAHPEVSHEILERIPFECPVADIVLQHHERLDGSGYPFGITESDILLEAKILAVADVVEAMASHRPYRPAAGIEAALAELTDNRGVLYDIAVVDACLRMISYNGFSVTDIDEIQIDGVYCPL
ncbi:MAG: HD domain-containing protein [Peptococcaceae bacterium]|nr:HD domain-containing protein [Peptococcaceae bacterium]